MSRQCYRLLASGSTLVIDRHSWCDLLTHDDSGLHGAGHVADKRCPSAKMTGRTRQSIVGDLLHSDSGGNEKDSNGAWMHVGLLYPVPLRNELSAGPNHIIHRKQSAGEEKPCR